MFAPRDGAFLGINIETMQQDTGLYTYIDLCNGILNDIYVTNM